MTQLGEDDMPQTTRRVVAPLGPQPRWPEGYITVLREAGAQEKTIPHCVAWVRRFFARRPGRRRGDLGRTEIERRLPLSPCLSTLFSS